MMKTLMICKYFYIFILCCVPFVFVYEWQQEGFSWAILSTCIRASMTFGILAFLSAYAIAKQKK